MITILPCLAWYGGVVSLERRRHERVPVKLPVRVEYGGESHTYLTHDVSISGIFVRTDVPQPLRKLISLKVQLLPSDQSIEYDAVVVHSIAAGAALEQGLVPGMGLQLYRLENNVRGLWEGYVSLLLRKFQEGEAGAELPENQVDPVRRKHKRFATQFHMTVTNLAPFMRVLSKDVSLGGVFLFSDTLLDVGQPVELHARKEDTGQEVHLHGEVARVVPNGPSKGFGVQFQKLEEDEEFDIKVFVPMIALDERDVTIEETELVPEGDPDLE